MEGLRYSLAGRGWKISSGDSQIGRSGVLIVGRSGGTHRLEGLGVLIVGRSQVLTFWKVWGYSQLEGVGVLIVGRSQGTHSRKVWGYSQAEMSQSTGYSQAERSRGTLVQRGDPAAVRGPSVAG